MQLAAINCDVTSTAAFFDVERGSIFIIGGNTGGEGFAHLGGLQLLLCFDIVQKEWLDVGIPDFPSSAHSGHPVVAPDETAVLVAGRKMFAGWFDKNGHAVETFCEVFSLNVGTD